MSKKDPWLSEWLNTTVPRRAKADEWIACLERGGGPPWPSLRTKEEIRELRDACQGWLDQHPDPKPKTFRESLGDAFRLLFGPYEPPPPPTAGELTRNAMEMTKKAWVKAHLRLCEEMLRETGGFNE